MENKLSFVVQGPVIHTADAADSYSTRQALDSIRTYYPGSEIILSTWKGSNVSGLDYDHLVLSNDPGAIVVSTIPNPYNHNRLILSSRNGIRCASCETVIKTRTDICFTSNAIRCKLSCITPTFGPYAIFSHYMLSTNYYVRNPLRMNLFYHASDIILVGKKKDMLLFFSAPLVSREDMVTKKDHIKMVAEQYLTLSSIAVSKHKIYNYKISEALGVRHFIRSEKYLFSSFNIFSIADMGGSFPGKLLHAFRPEANYSMEEIAALSGWYRRNKGLDAFSFVRAAEYFGKKIKTYLTAILS